MFERTPKQKEKLRIATLKINTAGKWRKAKLVTMIRTKRETLINI